MEQKTNTLAEPWANSSREDIQSVLERAQQLENMGKRARALCVESIDVSNRGQWRVSPAMYILTQAPGLATQLANAPAAALALAQDADALKLVNLGCMTRASLTNDWRNVAAHIRKQAKRALRGIDKPDQHVQRTRPLYGHFANNCD